MRARARLWFVDCELLALVVLNEESFFKIYRSNLLCNEILRAFEGMEAANLLVREELRRHPTLEGFEKLLEALLFEVSVEKRQDIQIFKTLIHQHSQRLAYYQCDACGFKARQFYWRCPACVAWETFPPRRIEESAS